MITSIKFNKDIFQSYRIIDSENIDNLNLINIFVGSNNSGKSRFLRAILSNEISIQSSEFESKKLSSILEILKAEINRILYPYTRSPEMQKVLEALNKIPDVFYLNSNQRGLNILNHLEYILQMTTGTVSDGTGANPQDLLSQVQNVISKKFDEIRSLSNKFTDDTFAFERSYIPTLRGLKPLQIENSKFDIEVDNYNLRSYKDYFETRTKLRPEIFTGLDLYNKTTQLLLGDSDDREKIREFESYLSSTFFNNETVNIVPRINKDVLYLKIGGDEHPIYDLGDGIQSIILLTYPLFFNIGKKMLFFIEEPETHLHPGLQRIFVETLRSKLFKGFQYFITTHSNHFLDLTVEYDDISIYSFQKKIEKDNSKFILKNVSSNHKQVLDLLGVRNSSIFLANCTIWVEGITDRLYLRRFLEILQSEKEIKYREDFHYSFIEYAGNNITHWSFLENEDGDFYNINIEGICSKIFLIADNDGVDLPSKRSKKKKQERHQQLKEKLGKNFYVTKGIEIENLLTKETIKKVIRELEKDENLDFGDFDKNDLSKRYIGDFIEDNVKGLKRKYRTEYGTIYNKVNFCKKAISYLKSVDDLSKEAKELSNLLLQFITSSQ